MNFLQQLIKKESGDVDKIIEYLQDDKGLTLMSDLEKEKYDRLRQCSRWIGQYGSREKVVMMMVNTIWKRTNGEDYKITERTAYRDYTDTQKVTSFGYGNEKSFWIDKLIGWVVETRNTAMAGDKKDLKAASSAEKLLFEIITTHLGDKDAEMYKQLQVPWMTMAFLPGTKQPLPENWEEETKRIIAKKSTLFIDNTGDDDGDED